MLKVLSEGWRLLTQHKKAVLFLYLANLMVASLLLVPFMETFDRSLGPGLYREQMVNSLDYDWYTLFRDRVTGLASTFAPWVMGAGPFAKNLEMLLDGEIGGIHWEILSVGGLYVFLQTFLLAAALGSIALDPKGTSTREFFRNGATFFGRFFRLSMLAMLAFWVIDAWLIGPLTSLVEGMAEGALTDREAFYWNLSRYLLVLVIFMVVNMLFDYANNQLTLSSPNRNHGINGLEAGLHGLPDRLSVRHSGSQTLRIHELFGIHRTFPVNRSTQSIDHPTKKSISNRHLDDSFGAFDQIPLLDRMKLTK